MPVLKACLEMTPRISFYITQISGGKVIKNILVSRGETYNQSDTLINNLFPHTGADNSFLVHPHWEGFLMVDIVMR